MLFADVSIMRSAKTPGGEHNDGSKGELLLLLILNFHKINVFRIGKTQTNNKIPNRLKVICDGDGSSKTVYGQRCKPLEK